MTDFNVETMMEIISQTLFGGNGLIAGLCIMVVVFLGVLAIFSRLGAPVHYALVPMIPLVIVFGYLGVVDTTISMLMVIVIVVMVAMQAKVVVGGK